MISVTNMENATTERVSDRVFRLLSVMAQMGDGPHSLQSIISNAELSRSTVQRILHSGVKEGFVRQNGHGRYSLATLTYGHVAYDAASRSMVDIEEIRQQLDTVSRETGCLALLHAALLAGQLRKVCVACCAPPGSPVREESFVGAVKPLEGDATGQVILAHLGDTQPRDPRLDTIRQRGYAVTPLFKAGSARIVAAPLLRGAVPVGAISVVGGEGMLRKLPHSIAVLRSTAARLNQG
jgi:DNA-binding IclR family transcriptional regulator